MRKFGAGEFQFHVVDNWAQRPRCWPFTDVVGVAVDSLDRVYVLNRGPHPMMVFDSDGQFIRSWGEGDFVNPHAVHIDAEDYVWCADDFGHAIHKFDTSGARLLTLGTPKVYSDTGFNGVDYDTVKRAAGPFHRPTKATIAPSGEIYVTDGYGNARVHVFSSEGKLLRSWGEPGREPGQFRLPHGVVVDASETVYVADRENNRIQVFNSQGEFVAKWEGARQPNDLVIVDEKYMFMAECGHRVSVWNLDGNMLGQWGQDEGPSNDAGLFMLPHGIAVDSRGVVYVGEVCDTATRFDRGSRAVQKFEPA
jgi:DNA-binding beta-propeller fold protein YncE